MATIQSVLAREILDSRGNPTVEVELHISGNIHTRASVPSGASKGLYEAMELRDGGDRYKGLGVQKAIALLKDKIAPLLIGKEVTEHLTLDQTLIERDGTLQKSQLGANTLLAVSLAMARGAAFVNEVPLYQYLGKETRYCMPVPMLNVMNGGMHVDNTLDIQEFMILPIGAPTFKEAVRYGAEITYALKRHLQKNGCSTAVGDEGGFAPNLPSHRAAIEMLLTAIRDAGFKAGQEVGIALDLASSTFYQNEYYHLALEGQRFTSLQFVDHLSQWIREYPILSIEDAMAETDQEGWHMLTARLGDKVQIVGDDLFVTNANRLKEGIIKKLANAILIKPNQVGTLKETLETMEIAKAANMNTVISHRSGETEDTFIADLAVATHAAQIKAGALCRSERVAKYNQLLRIEESLGDKAYYAGKKPYEVNHHV